MHQHDVTLAVTTGTLWLRVLVTAAVFLVAGHALLRPLYAPPRRVLGPGTAPGAAAPGGAAVPLLVTGCAAGAGTLLLVLADGLDGPRQLVLPLLAALAVPLVAAARRTTATRLAAAAARAAPWALSAAAAGTLLELGRAWLTAGGAGALPVRLSTAVLLALVGLSWSVWCWPGRAHRAALAQAIGGALAVGLVAASVHLELLTAAGTPGG